MIIHDEQFVPAATGIIEAAKSSVWVSTFKAQISDKVADKKLKYLFELIKNKAQVNIDTRFLLNWHEERRCVPGSNEYVIKYCKNSNIKIRHLKANRCCHAKIIIVDQHTAILGSHNLSSKSCFSNFEVSKLITGQEDVESLVKIYQQVWADAVKA